MVKKGWIRIFEAVLAIMLLTSVVLFLYTKQETKNPADAIYSIETKALDQISSNDTLRAAALAGDNASLQNFLNSTIPSTINYEIVVCEIGDSCKMQATAEDNIYVSEKLISSNLTQYSPKKVRIFMWQK